MTKNHSLVLCDKEIISKEYELEFRQIMGFSLSEHMNHEREGPESQVLATSRVK